MRRTGSSGTRHGAALPLLALVATLSAACELERTDRPAAGADTATADAVADTQAVRVEGVALSTPEAVIHDDQADVYLVSNINGDPLDKDGNGFISRVSPEGAVAQLRWIDGEADGVTLHAPKGMAFKGDTLFVADIDSVRAFSRATGEPWGARGVQGATFLNDVTVAPDGSVYVSDTGMGPGFEPSGSDAIHRFGTDGATAVARGEALTHPNGIIFHDGSLIMVPFGGAEVRRIPVTGDAAGTRDAEGGDAAGTVIATLPAGQLDGVIRLDDGSLLISSWEASAIYRVHTNGEAHVETVVENVPSPAAIGYDRQRQRVLIPVFTEDRLEFRVVR